MKVLAAIVLVVAAAWLWTSHTRAQTEHRLAAVASELAGRRVGVRCQGFWAALLDIQNRSGEVEFPQGKAPDHMFLTRDVCRRLRHLSSSRARRSFDCLADVDWQHFDFVADFDAPCPRRARGDAQAVNTLVHEAMHLRGFRSESQAQCYAIQGDAWAVIRLGGTEAEGDGVANLALALQPGVASEYQSGDCRPGGPLDLHPETSAWPSESPPALPM